jgi:hypothetical protein
MKRVGRLAQICLFVRLSKLDAENSTEGLNEQQDQPGASPTQRHEFNRARVKTVGEPAGIPISAPHTETACCCRVQGVASRSQVEPKVPKPQPTARLVAWAQMEHCEINLESRANTTLSHFPAIE